jgi:hypothetical protein
MAEQHSGVTLRCQAAHENQILPLISTGCRYSDPGAEWLKDKLLKTLEGYLAQEPETLIVVISIT